MAAPEFIFLVKPGVANPFRAPLAGVSGWLALGWQLADPADSQWLVEAPAEPAVDVMTRDELDDAVTEIEAELQGKFAATNPTISDVVLDTDGNRTSWVENGAACSATYDPESGNMLTLTINGLTRTFTYDSNGNMTGAS